LNHHEGAAIQGVEYKLSKIAVYVPLRVKDIVTVDTDQPAIAVILYIGVHNYK
jgi:hypothetical protein